MLFLVLPVDAVLHARRQDQARAGRGCLAMKSLPACALLSCALGLPAPRSRSERRRRSSPRATNQSRTPRRCSAARATSSTTASAVTRRSTCATTGSADLGLTEKQIVDNLMFTGRAPYDTMAIAMKPEDATRWFGVAPPDLSLIARSRAARTSSTPICAAFYLDPSRPTGREQHRAARLARCRHVLWELQGPQRAKFGTDAAGKEMFEGFEQIRPGEMPAAQFDEMVARHRQLPRLHRRTDQA